MMMQEIPEGCPFDPATERFACESETDEHGAEVTRSYAFLDGSGASKSAYDEDLTASISLRLAIDAHPSRDGNTGTIEIRHDLVASGLLGDESARTWNGTMNAIFEGVPPDDGPGCPGGPGGPGGPRGPRGPGGPRGGGRGDDRAEGGPGDPDEWLGAKTASATTIQGVIMPHPLTEESWPRSGSITRVTTITGGPNGDEAHTSVLTFDGTRYASLTIDGETRTVDLKMPGRPRG
jgi:hypothetical protein